MTQVFSFFDMDENGFIDQFEFICILVFLTRKKIASRIEAIFSIVDPDNNLHCEADLLYKLVEIIMRASRSNDKKKNQEQLNKEINSKISKIKSKRDSSDTDVNLEEFTDILLADVDLKMALINIGIFGMHELSRNIEDNDLILEVSKFETIEKELKGQREKEQAGTSGVASSLVGISSVFNQLGELTEDLLSIDAMMLDERSSPSNFKCQASDGLEPEIKIDLEYVYGYRCHDSRNNVFFNPEGRILFHASQVGVQLDYLKREQKFIMQETSEIACMDTYDNLTVTGEIAESPVLVLWENRTMHIESSFTSEISMGISHVKFSLDGKKLAVASLDSNRTIYVLSVEDLLKGQRASNLSLPQTL